MTNHINETHDSSVVSWVESANIENADFPIQNLPYCVSSFGVGVGIGDRILSLRVCEEAGLLDELPNKIRKALCGAVLNDLLALEHGDWSVCRAHFFALLRSDGDLALKAQRLANKILIRQADVDLLLPIAVGDFTDFECSHHHSKRMRKLMSGASKPLANGYYLPRAYHGRSSSVVVSGSPIYMPTGQIEDQPDIPAYSMSARFDYELELGVIIGTGNERGSPIAIDAAEDHIFGFCLLNDWSARDIQRWERLPLGPFLGKNHATSVSPWVITRDAMIPFRAPQTDPGEGWPTPLDYLHSERNEREGGLDVSMDVFVSSEKMRKQALPPHKTSSNRFLDAHWTISQFVAQHTCGGCNLRPGDLIGSGTISGVEVYASACLMELTAFGEEPFTLPTGEQRGFLQIGDEVVFKGESVRSGFARIGFGECRGRVSPPTIQG
jgi:fumarylacetoacetase